MKNWFRKNLWALVLALMIVGTGMNIIYDKGVYKSIYVYMGEWSYLIGGAIICIGLYIFYLTIQNK